MTRYTPTSSHLTDEQLDQLLRAAFSDKPVPSRDLTAGILERAADARVQMVVDTIFKKALSLGTFLGIALFACGLSVWHLITRWNQSDVSAFFSEASVDLLVIIERVGATPLLLILSSLIFAGWSSWKLTRLSHRKDLYVS